MGSEMCIRDSSQCVPCSLGSCSRFGFDTSGEGKVKGREVEIGFCIQRREILGSQASLGLIFAHNLSFSLIKKF